tara:strand:+ start:271 stop:597 length:327 start_codon:yes stop_codon:yes gene_type:complete
MEIYIKADKIPGIKPAIKSFPTEVSAYKAYKIITMLGGINEPNVPDAATVAVAKPLSYLYLSISGTAILDIAEAVATLDPHAEAKRAEAPTDAIAKPPGNLVKKTCVA